MVPSLFKKKLTYLFFFILLPNFLLAEKGPDWGVLRVCADPNSMPLSNIKREGFENQLAQLFANDLGWKVSFANIKKN